MSRSEPPPHFRAGSPNPAVPGIRNGNSAVPRISSLLGLFVAFALPSPGSAAVPSSFVAPTLLLDATLAGNAVVAVGERGAIVRSDDHARSWTAVESRAESTLTGIAFANDAIGWAVGHDSLILTTHDGGRSWSKQWQSQNLQDSFLDVVALDSAHAIAVGGYGLYLSTEDGGTTWSRHKITDDDYHFNRIVVSDTGLLPVQNTAETAVPRSNPLYLAGEHGTLLRSTDAGASWQPLHVPYEGSLYGVLPLGPHQLLVYGLRGRVFHSDDDGQTWTSVATDASWLISTAVRLRDGAIVLAGNGRTLLYSDNARRSFVARDVGAPAAIAELLVLPDGNLLAVGEAGAVRIDPIRLAPQPPHPKPEAPK